MTDKTEVVATAVMSALAVGSFLVFGKSVIDHAFTIGNGEFRCSIEINCAHHSAACQVEELPADWKFTIAYNAGLQAATAALVAAGYRASRDNHHYRVIQSLEYTIAPGPKVIGAFDGFRKKRNVSS